MWTKPGELITLRQLLKADTKGVRRLAKWLRLKNTETMSDTQVAKLVKNTETMSDTQVAKLVKWLITRPRR